MLTHSPSIAPEVYRIAPGFRALSIYVKAAPVLNPDVGRAALLEACEAVLAGRPEWVESHLAAWAGVFQSLAPNQSARLVQLMRYVSACFVMA